MPENWTDHTLDNPAENLPCAEPSENLPCAEPLELFVRKIGWALRPGEDRKCNWEEIARMLCQEFKLKPPVLGDKIRTFFEVAGIYHDVAPCNGETTFIPNRTMSRWEIYTRPCATYEWSREVWHEVWEILFWRCYHVIPWWKQWAAQNGCYCPHDKADDFAYHVLLSPKSVAAQSKKRQYDLYKVADYYSVPTNLAFRAMQSCSRFTFPLLFVVLRLNAKPPDPTSNSLQGDLFDDVDSSSKMVYGKVYHKVYKKETCSEVEVPFGFELQKKKRELELTFQSLSSHFRQGNSMRIDAEDPIYLYSQQPDPRQWTVSHLFGLDLPVDVTVITRQSPRCRDEVFLQIMPPGDEAAFQHNTNEPTTAEGLLQYCVQTEWKQAARGISKSKGSTGRFSLPSDSFTAAGENLSIL